MTYLADIMCWNNDENGNIYEELRRKNSTVSYDDCNYPKYNFMDNSKELSCCLLFGIDVANAFGARINRQEFIRNEKGKKSKSYVKSTAVLYEYLDKEDVFKN